jgi:hypothetical protein
MYSKGHEKQKPHPDKKSREIKAPYLEEESVQLLKMSLVWGRNKFPKTER